MVRGRAVDMRKCRPVLSIMVFDLLDVVISRGALGRICAKMDDMDGLSD